MNTTFKLNQIVKANITAQGMTAGLTYKVVGIEAVDLPFGTFVTYCLEHEGKPIQVANGHLLLTSVNQ